MSTFMDMMTDMLPVSSELQKTDNPLRRVLDKSVGAYMDELPEIFDELFLTSATGGWLDAFGRDYGVSRRLDETDDSYRERIIFEKLEYLTAHNLQSIYNVGLFNAFDGFNPVDNNLTSDNTYLTDFYMGVADTDIQNILNKKFIFDSNFIWFNGSELDYIINTSNIGVLRNYLKLYEYNRTHQYFENNTSLKKVKLTLPKTIYCNDMFKGCTGLTDVKLVLDRSNWNGALFEGCTSLVNADITLVQDSTLVPFTDTYVGAMFRGCTSLKNVKLVAPYLSDYTVIFKNCSALESIDVVIAENKVSGFKSYVLGLDLANLTSFIVNGEEVDLS